jgi:hypothetical protein
VLLPLVLLLMPPPLLLLMMMPLLLLLLVLVLLPQVRLMLRGLGATPAGVIRQLRIPAAAAAAAELPSQLQSHGRWGIAAAATAAAAAAVVVADQLPLRSLVG